MGRQCNLQLINNNNNNSNSNLCACHMWRGRGWELANTNRNAPPCKIDNNHKAAAKERQKRKI